MLNRKELKEKVPHGYGKKIAERANVSLPSITKWFKGQLDSDKIEIAVLETLAEISDNKKERDGHIEALLAKIL